MDITPDNVILFLFYLLLINTFLFFGFLCVVLAPYIYLSQQALRLNAYKQFQTKLYFLHGFFLVLENIKGGKILFFTSDSIHGILKDYAVKSVFTIESAVTKLIYISSAVSGYKLRIQNCDISKYCILWYYKISTTSIRKLYLLIFILLKCRVLLWNNVDNVDISMRTLNLSNVKL